MAELPQIKKELENIVRLKNPAEPRGQYLRLDKNENLITFPPAFMKKVRQVLTADFISIYPEFDPVYETLAKWLGLKTANLFITAGSDAAIKAVFEVFISKGDKVAVMHPTYAMYYVYSQIFNAEIIKIGYDENLDIKTQDIIDCLKNNRPKLLCIANPNSPTGTVIGHEDLLLIIKSAEEYGTVVLIDEAYYLYYEKSVIDLVDRFSNLIVTRTFSKAFGLASARFGFAASNERLIGFLNKVRPLYETNAYAAELAKLAVENYDIIKSNVQKTQTGKKYLERELKKMGLKFRKSYANFVLIDVGSPEKSKEIVAFMKTKKILIGGNFNYPGMQTCIRVTVGSKKQMERFLAELRSVL